MSQSDETVEQLTSAVRRFVREELLPAEPQVEEDDEIPERIVVQMTQLGLFGMTIPEEFGGLGLSMYEEARVVFEIGYASPVFRSYFGTSNGVGTLRSPSPAVIPGRRSRTWRAAVFGCWFWCPGRNRR